MNRCVNLRPEDDGSFSDIISQEQVAERDLVSFSFNDQQFCYDSLTLLRYLDHLHSQGQQPMLPERFPLSEDQMAQVYQHARQRYPQVFMVTDGDRATPYSFATLESAVSFVSTRARGTVYQLAQVDTPELAMLLYPEGLSNVIPVFALRREFLLNDAPLPRPVRYHPAAPGSPPRPIRQAPVAPGAPRRQRPQF
jgi:hypothetical protein